MATEIKDIEIFEDQGGGFRFRVKGRNGEIMATSQAYTRREDADRGFMDLFNRMQEIVLNNSA